MTFSSRRDVDFADFDFDFDANDARTGERETVVMVERNERAAAAVVARVGGFTVFSITRNLRESDLCVSSSTATTRAAAPKRNETKRNARTDGLRDAPGAR